MTTFSLKDNFASLGNQAFASLNRKIDNEIAGEPLPSPYTATNERPVVKTADNELGRSKFAGTGSSVVDNLPKAAIIIGGLGLAGVIAFVALR